MDDRSLFLNVLTILLIFNIAYLFSKPPADQVLLINQMTYGGVLGVLLSVAGTALVAGSSVGVSILGTGVEYELDSQSIKILFGFGVLLSLMFQVDLGPISIGVGLINPIFEVFMATGVGFLALIGFLVATVLALMEIISGVMMIQG